METCGGSPGGHSPGASWRSRTPSVLDSLLGSGLILNIALQGSWEGLRNLRFTSGRLGQPHISVSELHLFLSPESSPSDPSANTPSSYPTLSEVFGRKRKKRTSIETNIRLTLEKRFQDVSNQPPRVGVGGPVLCP